MSHFNGIELFFLICAVIGGFFVGGKLVLQFFVGDVETDFDTDIGFLSCGKQERKPRTGLTQRRLAKS